MFAYELNSPTGANCIETGTTIGNVTAQEGYFLGLDDTGTMFIPCLNEACGSEGCIPGYTGSSCTTCDGEDLVLGTGFTCSTCLPMWQTVSIFVAGGLAFGLFLAYKMSGKRVKTYKSRSVFFKIVISSLQLNGLALTFAFNWDDLMSGYLETQSSITSLGTTYLEVQCLQSEPTNTFVTNSLIYLLAPLVLAATTFLFSFCYRLCKYRNHPNMYQHVRTKSIRTAIGAGVVIVFILQPDLVKRAALILSCVKMGADDTDVFMTENLSIRCWHYQHWLYIGTFGLLYLTFYVIGIPLGMYRILSSPVHLPMVRQIIADTEAHLASSEKQELLDQMGSLQLDNPSEPLETERGSEKHSQEEHNSLRDDSTKDSPNVNIFEAEIKAENATASESVEFTHFESVEFTHFYNNFSFLFLGYTQEAFYWELVVICRKAAISIIGVSLATDMRAQGMFGMVVMFVATVMHANYKPFHEDWLNSFEFLSLFASSATFFLGVFTVDAGENGQKFAAASMLAAAVNLIYVAGVMFYGIHLHTIEKRRKTLSGVTTTERRLKPKETDNGEKCSGAIELTEIVTTTSSEAPVNTVTAPVNTVTAPVNIVTAPNEKESQAKLVTAIMGYAGRTGQLSFNKGDVIRVTRDDQADKWHTGVLYSSDYPLTGEALLYPSRFVTRHELLDEQDLQPREEVKNYVVATTAYESTKANILSFEKGDVVEVMPQRNGKWQKGVLVQSSKLSVPSTAAFFPPSFFRDLPTVTARGSFSSTKDVQMSFMMGDTIGVYSDEGNKWHKGILVFSSKYKFTGKVLYYPSNFMNN